VELHVGSTVVIGPVSHRIYAAVAVVAGAVALALPSSAAAVKPIAECTDQAVRSAVAAGGNYVFQCDTPTALPISAPLTVTSPVSLDATGHTVFLNNPKGRVFNVKAGSLELVNLGVRGGLVGGNGPDGDGGFAGGAGTRGALLECTPANAGETAGAGADGKAGTNGTPAADGGTAQGGTIYVAAGASVRLYGGRVLGSAKGGNGGNGGRGGDGGWGGDGGSVIGSCTSDHHGGVGGDGDDGGRGAAGGDGGDAEGGAIYVETGALLSATGTSFQNSRAQGGDGGDGGYGGWGGWRGEAGQGCCPGAEGSPGSYSGSGGRGGRGGDAGAGRGGSIYSEGTVVLRDVSFEPVSFGSGSQAMGGQGGDGANGGGGGSGGWWRGDLPPVGDGANGGDGGAGGAAAGGALFSSGTLEVFSATFFYSRVGQDLGFGFSGSGGAGGAGGGAEVANPAPGEGIPGDGGDGGDGGDVSFASIWGSVTVAGCADILSEELIPGPAGPGGPAGSQGTADGLEGVPGLAGTDGAAGQIYPTAIFQPPPCEGMRINEFMLSAGDDPAAQFVELSDQRDEPFSDVALPYKLVVYDSAGQKAGDQVISASLLQDRDNTQPLLLSTPAADAALDMTGDLPLLLSLPRAGQACFTRGGVETRLSCVAWGCVTSLVSPDTSLAASPPDGQSAQRRSISQPFFAAGQPTPGEMNASGAESPHCLDPDSASGGDQSGPQAPQGGQPPAANVKQASKKPEPCITRARRSLRMATKKAKGLSGVAGERTRQKATRKYQRAIRRCRAKSS
jgi:hypothetical protein